MQDFQEDEKKNHNRIMLVEDDTTITHVLKRQLERWGYEVFDTVDFEHVMEAFAGWKPDLVLMDIDMPEMDGIETAKRIMEMTDRTVPILFVTALCDRQTVTLCRNLDAAGYIVRPYKPVFVKTEIKRILMGRSEIE